MVLKIFNGSDVYAYKDIDRTFFRTKSYGGMMYLQFDIPVKHELYKYLAEEVRLEYDGQYYLVKGINERTKAGVSTINAELDLSGLDSVMFLSKTFTNESFGNVCREILAGTGWSIDNADLISKRTTLEITDNTARQILETCTNTTAYGTCYEFDSINKVIHLIKPENNTDSTGCYFTDELNLSELTFKGNSSSLVTRLYVYGKDGLSIASVNDGKEYIDNNSYTDKVIVSVWRDERYTNPTTLLEDGRVKLAALAVPERSYICKVVDLAKIHPEIYGDILKYDLYDVITLVDRNRQTRIDHRIVEIKEYPADPALNTVTLSSIAGRITGKINNLNNKITQLDAQQLHDRTKVNEIVQDLDSTVLRVSEGWASSKNESLIKQTADGLFFQVDEVIGGNRWRTVLQQSSEDIRMAWNGVSEYIQFANSKLNIKDSSGTLLMTLHSGGQDVFDDYGNLIMRIDSNGQKFYKNNTLIGKTGTNTYSGTSYKGIVFDLDYAGNYLTWASADSEDAEHYTTKFTYISNKNSIDGMAKDTLHTGCAMDMHNNYLNNAVIKDWSFSGGTCSGTFSGKYITEVHQDGTFSYKSFSLKFKDGILQSASW